MSSEAGRPGYLMYTCARGRAARTHTPSTRLDCIAHVWTEVHGSIAPPVALRAKFDDDGRGGHSRGDSRLCRGHLQFAADWVLCV